MLLDTHDHHHQYEKYICIYVYTHKLHTKPIVDLAIVTRDTYVLLRLSLREAGGLGNGKGLVQRSFTLAACLHVCQLRKLGHENQRRKRGGGGREGRGVEA